MDPTLTAEHQLAHVDMARYSEPGMQNWGQIESWMRTYEYQLARIRVQHGGPHIGGGCIHRELREAEQEGWLLARGTVGRGLCRRGRRFPAQAERRLPPG